MDDRDYCDDVRDLNKFGTTMVLSVFIFLLADGSHNFNYKIW